MINNVTSFAYTEPVNKQQNSQTAQNTTNQSQNKPNVDTVSISDAAIKLQIPDFFPLTENGTITVKEIEESLAETNSFIEQNLQALYSQLGIPKDAQIDFSIGHDGSIIVSGDETKLDQLEDEINNTSELSNSFRKASANASLLRAIEEHEKFAAAYAQNPAAAVEYYRDLLDDINGFDVIFSYKDEQLDTKISNL